MDVPLVLQRLGLAEQDWGPGGNSGSTYEQLAAGWRGTVAVPPKADMEAAWQQILAERRRPRTAEAVEEDLVAWAEAGPDPQARLARVARLASRALALAVRGQAGASLGDIPVAADEPIPPGDE